MSEIALVYWAILIAALASLAAAIDWTLGWQNWSAALVTMALSLVAVWYDAFVSSPRHMFYEALGFLVLLVWLPSVFLGAGIYRSVQRWLWTEFRA